MTKRLTIKNSDGTYSQPTETTFEMIFNKLAQLEDVLEKYNLNTTPEQLDDVLHFCKTNMNAFEEYADTWAKACELACEDISAVKIITNENMAESDNLPNYFYQQAKKELENEQK